MIPEVFLEVRLEIFIGIMCAVVGVAARAFIMRRVLKTLDPI